MSFIAVRSFKVQKAGGGFYVAKPGQTVPEVETWPNPGAWVKRGYIRPSDGSEVTGLDRGKLVPPRAVTQADMDRRAAKLQQMSDEMNGAPPAGPEDEDEPESSIEFSHDGLDKLKKKDLLKMAEEAGLGLTHHASKEEIIGAILGALKAAEEAGA